jgi:hypothetical protein
MGLADFLSSALTVGTQAAGAREKGVATRRKAETADLLERIKLMRQQQQDAMAQQLQQAQIGNYESLAADRAKPPEPPAPRRQVVDGQLVDLDAGTAAPIAGFTPRPPNPDPMTRFFEGQRQLQDRQDADRWQQLYLRYLGNPSDPNSESMSPAEAAAAADEAFGGHPRLAPKVGGAPALGTNYTPSRSP